MTAFIYIKLVVKLLLFLLALPFAGIYLLVKYSIFKFKFHREVRKYGLDKDLANTLIAGLSPFNIFKKAE